jgi:hypothetical protein
MKRLNQRNYVNLVMFRNGSDAASDEKQKYYKAAYV